MKDFFNYTLLEFENFKLTVSSILALLLLIIVVNLILRVIKKAINSTSKIDFAKKYSIYTLIKYFILVFTTVFALQILDFNLSVLLAGSAALLVGIGLGLQNLFSDFISGIILLVESKIKVDDIIEVNELVCKVQEINLRTTTVLTRDDKYIILPNTELTKNRFVNWTHNAVASRFEVTVGVSYSSDVNLVKKVLKEVADNQEGVLKNPAPFVRFNDFGDSSLNFSVHFWSEEVYRVENIKSDMRTSIFELFTSNNINIPFPQRVIHHVPGSEDNRDNR
jgi:small-conductance mechanosensitive channel